MQQPQIYFDIDKTMLDTKQLMINCQSALQRVGVDESLFATTLNQYIATLPNKTFFDPDVFLDSLAQKTSVAKRTIEECFWQPKSFAEALFPEVLDTLQTLSVSSQLGIFSQGVVSWQQKKIELSGILEFFSEEKRIIESDKLAKNVIDRLEQHAWVIDDKETVVETLQSTRPDLKVFWIVRTETLQNQNSISSLSEIVRELF